MPYETVQLQIEERIARITLNRPERLNALSAQLTEELGDAVEEVSASDENVRCLILTGAGRAFCAGGDTG
ncbi:MAG: enoyl-CoA hydratase-related protein, partial [Dehalococcoidia bacterium]